jgi:hypothetical protein
MILLDRQAMSAESKGKRIRRILQHPELSKLINRSGLADMLYPDDKQMNSKRVKMHRKAEGITPFNGDEADRASEILNSLADLIKKELR